MPNVQCRGRGARFRASMDALPSTAFDDYLPVIRFRVDFQKQNSLLYQLANNIVVVLAPETHYTKHGYTIQHVINGLLHYYKCWACDCLEGCDASFWTAILTCLSSDYNTQYRRINEIVYNLDKVHDYVIQSKPMRSTQVIELKDVPCLDKIGLHAYLKEKAPSIVVTDTDKNLPDLQFVHQNKKEDFSANFVCDIHYRLSNLLALHTIDTMIHTLASVIHKMSTKKVQQNLLCLFGVCNLSASDTLTSVRTPSNLLLLLNACKNDIVGRPVWDKLVWLEEDVRHKMTAENQNCMQPIKSLERLLFYFNRAWKEHKKKHEFAASGNTANKIKTPFMKTKKTLSRKRKKKTLQQTKIRLVKRRRPAEKENSRLRKSKRLAKKNTT